jgi:hypothetical protein
MPKAFEAKPDNIAVAQLVNLHADLGGKLLACEAQASRLASDMRHVEAVIRMFDPAYDVRRIAVKRRQKKNPWFKRGHMFRAGDSRAALGRSGRRRAYAGANPERDRGATANAGQANRQDRGEGRGKHASEVDAIRLKTLCTFAQNSNFLAPSISKYPI